MIPNILTLAALMLQITTMDGEIRDIRNHASIGFARIEFVRLDGSKDVRYSDGNGRFHLEYLDQGRYLSIAHPGYETTIVPIDRVRNGRVEIELTRIKSPREIPGTISRDVRRLLEQAEKEMRKGNLDAAETAARNAQDLRHGGPEVHLLLAKIYGQKHDERQAVDQLKIYLKEAPDGPESSRIRTVLNQSPL